MATRPLVLLVTLQDLHLTADIAEFKADLEGQGIEVMTARHDDSEAVVGLLTHARDNFHRLLCMVSIAHAAWAFDNRLGAYFPRPIVVVLYDNPSLYPYEWKPGDANVVFAASESRRDYIRHFLSPTFDTIPTQSHADPAVLAPPPPLSLADYLGKRPQVCCAMNMRISQATFESFGETIRGFAPPLRRLADALVEELLTAVDERPAHRLLLDLHDDLGLGLRMEDLRQVLFAAESYAKLWRRWHVYRLLSSAADLPVVFRGNSYPEYDLRARPRMFAGPADYARMVDDIRQSRISLSVTLPMPELLCERVQMAIHSGTLAVVNENHRVRELFTPGRDILTHRFDDDLVETLRHYLAHPEEAFAIVEAGRANLAAGPLSTALRERLSQGFLAHFDTDLRRLGWSPAA